jgi:GT2 family glycosyltransferase
MLSQDFPQVKVIENQDNLGYSKANNLAISISTGKYILLINPDTYVLEGSIDLLCEFMQSHSDVGIVGPKIVNRDGSFQRHCKRGIANPWEVLSYFLGLSSLFPQSRRFSGYLQGHLDQDETHYVPAISGACMLIRGELIKEIGQLDEQFFAYQEDTDYCVRAGNAGWKVAYYPASKVVHIGGRGGSREAPYRAIKEWHRSYYFYYKKYFAKQYGFIVNSLIYAMMIAKLGISLLLNLLRQEKYPGPRRG